MYSREMGGIKSDGQLYGMPSTPPMRERESEPPPHEEVFRREPPCKEEPVRKGLLDLSFLQENADLTILLRESSTPKP